METLTSLPNIGKTLAEKLEQAGFKTQQDLINAGLENIYIRLITIDPDSCINSFYAVAGAIEGIRWHHLSESKKHEVKILFKQLANSK